MACGCASTTSASSSRARPPRTKGWTCPSQTELNDQFALPEVLGREPGVIGEFFVERVDGDDLADFVARQQAEVSPTFDVLPSGAREEYWVVARASAELTLVDDRDRRPVGCSRGASAHVVARHWPSLCVANGPAVGRSAQRRRRRAHHPSRNRRGDPRLSHPVDALDRRRSAAAAEGLGGRRGRRRSVRPRSAATH